MCRSLRCHRRFLVYQRRHRCLRECESVPIVSRTTINGPNVISGPITTNHPIPMTNTLQSA
ncbi:hypothetical protein CPB86DRAFT_414213 [Serendipita vermifera]|nr:hypothetical protein CPB86DRAFT_414213 [Serendipita vermifera]